MLRIGEAAKRAGVTPATFRRWEAQGLINSVRTAGGERRYREEDIDRLLSETQAVTPRRAPTPRAKESSHELDGELAFDEDDSCEAEVVIEEPREAVQPWERRVHEARADLEVKRLQEEMAELERGHREAEQSREQHRLRDQRKQDVERANQEAERLELIRLASIRSQGEFIATLTGAPPELRAAVTKDLSSYVSLEQFPSSLNSWQVREYLSARIESAIKPWRDQRAAEQKAEDDQHRCDTLRLHGRMHARSRTAAWEWADGERARREVEHALRDEIAPDWTREDVIELVDEVLEDWDE